MSKIRLVSTSSVEDEGFEKSGHVCSYSMNIRDREGRKIEKNTQAENNIKTDRRIELKIRIREL